MKARTALLLGFTTLAGAGAIVAGAQAQQPPAAPPSATEPAKSGAPGAGPMGGPMAGHGERAERGPRYSAEDRAAFFDARIAAVKAGLRLTPDQEKMWPSVETAVREMVKQRMEAREKARGQTPPADMIERMARMGEAATTRGAAMTKLADAARPLYASLNDEQKRRLRILSHPMRGGEGRHGMMRDGGRRGGDDRHSEGRGGDHHGRHSMMRGDDHPGERDGRRGEGRDRGDRRDERFSGGFDGDRGGWRNGDDRRGPREDYYRR